MDATPINTVSGLGGGEASSRAGSSSGSGRASTAQPPASFPVGDTVEVSAAGLALSQTDVHTCLRFAQICRIRAEIKAGTFVTPERIDGTVARLLEVIGEASRT